MAKTVKVPPADLPDVVLGLLGGDGMPLAVGKIKPRLTGAYKVAPAVLVELLESLVHGGRCHRFPQGKGVAYGALAPVVYARRVLESMLAKPKKKYKPDKLQAEVRKLTPQVSPVEFETLVDAARSARKLFIHPAPTAKGKPQYAGFPPDPTTYLKSPLKALEKIVAYLAHNGISREESLQAVSKSLNLSVPDSPVKAMPASVATVKTPSLEECGEAILRTMPQIDTAAQLGSLVFFRDLRRALPTLDKPTFDRAVIHLAQTRGDVALHHHDHALRLSPEERATLVEGPDQRHYIGIALKR